VHKETGVLAVVEAGFTNYGETIVNTPGLTLFPKTVAEVQRVVSWAREAGRRVRCAGMKHSWSDVFSNTGEVLVMLLPLQVTDTISFARVGLGGLEAELANWGSSLSRIELVRESEGGKQALVRVGAATTNLEMLNWSNQSGWTLPMDIIAVMITYGGSNAMICHGAGLHTQTLSDMVVEMDVVTADGSLVTVSDPTQLRSIAGCFGLAGIVTSITLRLDAMTYARFHPKKTRMAESIPRPGADPASQEFRKMVELCTQHYYTEFFWFPNRGEEEGYWENCWNNDGVKEDAIDINLAVDDEYQVATTYMFELIMKVLQPLTLITREEHYDEDTSLQEVLRYLFTKVVSLAGVSALPAPPGPLTTTTAEALHFRRGFHYIAVREMEMEIPVPSLPGGTEPDWSIVSRAWWDAVDLIQKSEERGVFAVDMTLELRIMGGSEVVMAPQHGNKHGTLAIEPVSTRIVHRGVWEDFKQELAKTWMNYKDWDGTPLKSRVHWAKESPRSVHIDGEEIETLEYWQRLYQPNMAELFRQLAGLREGVSVADLQAVFSNHYLDQLFRPHWLQAGVELERREDSGLVVDRARGPPGNQSKASETAEESETSSACCTLS